jgi:hypothetical protein
VCVEKKTSHVVASPKSTEHDTKVHIEQQVTGSLLPRTELSPFCQPNSDELSGEGMRAKRWGGVGEGDFAR